MDRRVYDNYVIKIVKEGNLSKAAVSLGISQPALSSGLTALENELGFKIFNRKRVPITFTPQGELYYEYLTKMQVLSEDFQQRLENYQKEKSSKVVIGGPGAYVEATVTDAVIKLRRENPDYKVVIKSSTLSELIEKGTKGEINCFVSTSEEIPENFEKHLVKKEKVYLCIPTDNPINQELTEYRITDGKKGKIFDYSVLDGEDFIFLEEGQPLREEMEKFFLEYGISPENNITVNQVSTALNITTKGEGISFVSEDALACGSDNGKVCIYELPDSISGRNIYVAYNKDLFMPKAAERLVELLINKE